MLGKNALKSEVMRLWNGGSIPAADLRSRGHVTDAPPTFEEAHLKLLRLLEANPRMAQRDLAEAMGVSVGKTNYCLKALLEKGLIKVGNFRRSDNKLAYAYILTPAGFSAKASLTLRFLARKTAEYERLRGEIEELHAEAQRGELPQVRPMRDKL